MEYNQNAADSSGDYSTSSCTIDRVYTVTADRISITPSISSNAIDPESRVSGYWWFPY
jgi:hypothetical protein